MAMEHPPFGDVLSFEHGKISSVVLAFWVVCIPESPVPTSFKWMALSCSRLAFGSLPFAMLPRLKSNMDTGYPK